MFGPHESDPNEFYLYPHNAGSTSKSGTGFIFVGAVVVHQDRFPHLYLSLVYFTPITEVRETLATLSAYGFYIYHA